MAITKTGNIFEDAETAFLGVGFTAAGQLTVDSGSELILDDPDNTGSPFIIFGRHPGGNGTGLVTGAGSLVHLIGSGLDGAGLQVGRLGPGTLTVENGAAVRIEDPINDGDTYSGLAVARETGNGTMVFDDATLDVEGPGTYFQVGRDGGTGSASFLNGSTVNFLASSANLGSSFQIGRGGGNGTVLIDDSTFNFEATNVGVSLSVGVHGGAPGTGLLTISNSGSLVLEGTRAFANVGSQPGSSGEVQILSGGSLLISHTDADPYQGSMSIGGVAGPTKAEVLVAGPGSLLDADGWLEIGVNPYGGSPAAGNGRLTVNGGGTVIVEDGAVGRGGVLRAGHGQLVMGSSNFDVVNGALALLPTLGRFEVDGSLFLDQQSTLRFLVAGDGSAAGHLMMNGGTASIGMDVKFEISPLEGYQFSAGQSFQIVSTTAGGQFDFNDGFDFRDIVVTGQEAGFGFSLGYVGTGLGFSALNNGDGTGAANLLLGSASALASEFTYDAATGFGTGAGGNFAEGLLARNADAIFGTAAGDNLSVTGTGGVTLDGQGGNDVLQSEIGDDALAGAAGADTLVGGLGNDTLDGGTNPEGASGQGDVLLGGDGDDLYLVDSGLDLVDEGSFFPTFGFGGTDTIVSTTDFYWDIASVGENLTISEDVADAGGDGVTAVGGIFDNTITGHSGIDIMFGRGGSDVYRGGDGVNWYSLSLLGLTEDNAYVGVDGPNTVVMDERESGPFSYHIVFEFESGKDKVDVSDFAATNSLGSGAAVLARAVDDGAGSSYIALGDGLDYLYMVGLEKAELAAGDFVV